MKHQWWCGGKEPCVCSPGWLAEHFEITMDIGSERDYGTNFEDLRATVDTLRQQLLTERRLRHDDAHAHIQERIRWADELAHNKSEIAADNRLLSERQRLLDACPCPVHGSCVPHVLDVLKKVASGWPRCACQDADGHHWLRVLYHCEACDSGGMWEGIESTLPQWLKDSPVYCPTCRPMPWPSFDAEHERLLAAVEAVRPVTGAPIVMKHTRAEGASLDSAALVEDIAQFIEHMGEAPGCDWADKIRQKFGQRS